MQHTQQRRTSAGQPAVSRGRWVLSAALLVMACAPKGDDRVAAGDSSATAAATPVATGADTQATAAAAPADSGSAAKSAGASSTAAGTTAKAAGTDSTGPKNKVETRGATTQKEAAKLDAASRTAARQGATTRDTSSTGRVTPPPATRKTAATTPTDSARTSSAGASVATRTPADTARTSAAAKPSDSTAAGGGAAGGAAPAGSTQTAAAQGGGDHLTASPAAYEGWKTFHVYCYRCHGVDALGSDLAPNLRHSVSPEGSVTHEVFVTTVKEGRLPKGMPSWKELLDDKQIENLYAYVKARSNGSLAAGRPRRGTD